MSLYRHVTLLQIPFDELRQFLQRCRFCARRLALRVDGFALTYVLMRLMGRRWSRRTPDWAVVYHQKQRQPLDCDYKI